MLEHWPELFSATRDGLTVPVDVIDEHVFGDGITRSVALHTSTRDQWLLCATRDVWFLLPEAFGIEDSELPAYVQDRRDTAVAGVAF